eukprot:6875989-Prymnesium_polylepis.1
MACGCAGAAPCAARAETIMTLCGSSEAHVVSVGRCGAVRCQLRGQKSIENCEHARGPSSTATGGYG